MVLYKYKGKGRARRAGRRVRRPRRSYARKTTIKKMIKSEISRNLENKTYQFLGNPGVDLVPASSPGFDSSIIPVAPHAAYLAINQGSGQGGRVGNKIKITKLKLGGVLIPLGYNASTNTQPVPLNVKLWLFYDKEDTQSIPSVAASNDFFQFGSTTIGFSDRLFDHSMPVNKDRYRVLATRTYKIGYASYTGTGSVPTQGNFANNDFKLNQNINIDLTKLVPKNYIFRDNNSTPTTRGLYMMWQPVYANGNAMASTQVVARFSYMLTVEYEDA